MTDYFYDEKEEQLKDKFMDEKEKLVKYLADQINPKLVNEFIDLLVCARKEGLVECDILSGQLCLDEEDFILLYDDFEEYKYMKTPEPDYE